MYKNLISDIYMFLWVYKVILIISIERIIVMIIIIYM